MAIAILKTRAGSISSFFCCEAAASANRTVSLSNRLAHHFAGRSSAAEIGRRDWITGGVILGT